MTHRTLAAIAVVTLAMIGATITAGPVAAGPAAETSAAKPTWAALRTAKPERVALRIAGWRTGRVAVPARRLLRDVIRVLPAGRHVVHVQARRGQDWRTIRRPRTKRTGWLTIRLRAPRAGTARYRVLVPPSQRHARSVTVVRRVAAKLRPQPPRPKPPTHVWGSDGMTVTTYLAGDIGKCPPKGDPALTAAMMLARPGAPILALGDIAYVKGSAANYATCYHPFWGSFADRTWPVPGNHDYRSGARPYFAYFGARVGVLGTSWYALRLGSWHILMLDSNCGRDPVGGCDRGSRQYQWVARYLAANRPKCLAAATHHPRYSSGNRPFARMAPLWGLLTRYDADALFSGHAHSYQRFDRMANNGRPGRGPRQFAIGTGGATLVPPKQPPGRGLRFADGDHYGLLQVTLRPDGYDWAFLPTSGGILDPGSDTC